MMRKLNIFSYKLILAFAAILFIVSFIFPVNTLAEDYLKVDDSWTFTANMNLQDFNDLNNSTDISRIIASNGSSVAVFNYNKTNSQGDEYTREYLQSPDYYSQEENARSCAAHFDLKINTKKITRNATIVTPIGCGANQSWVTKGVDLTAETPPTVAEAASFINWGSKPIGCPSFGGEKALDELSGQSRALLNYNCPNGTSSVKNGALQENSLLESEAVDPNTENGGTTCADAGFVLGWIICPVGSALAEITVFVDNQLYSLLYIDTGNWGDSGVEEAWSNIRTISSALIVLVALVAIASQIFNFEIVSAYTIRKILPKLFIAVILIQLSYFLGVIAINISNTVGLSTQAIISAPFESIPTGSDTPLDAGDDGWIGFSDVLTVFANNSDNANVTGGIVGSATVIGGLLASGTILALAGAASAGAVIMYIFALLIPAVISILVAFVVIILRVVLIIGLLIAAPLALVAWILPNTSKWFDRWWGLFFAMLAFFPIIIAFITIGKVGSIIIATSSNGTAFRDIVILTGVMIAYFLPYFLIFKVIRFSSGALGKIQGAIDTVSNKAREAGPIKSFREQGMKSGQYSKKQKDSENASVRTPDGSSRFTKAKDSFRRTRGRSGMGTLGAIGGYAAVARGEEEKGAMDNARFEMAQITAGKGGPAQAKEIQAILGKKAGEEATLADGKTKVKVTESLQRQAIATATALGEVDLMRDFVGSSDDLTKARNKEIFNTAMSTDGLFGKIDQIAPYLARSSNSDATAADQMGKSLENFGVMKTGDSDVGARDKKAPHRDVVKGLDNWMLGLKANGKAITQKDADNADKTISQMQAANKQQVAIAINQFASRTDLGSMDPSVIQIMGQVGGGEAQKVIDAAGNMRMEIAKDGSLKAVASNPGSSGPTPSSGGTTPPPAAAGPYGPGGMPPGSAGGP